MAEQAIPSTLNSTTPSTQPAPSLQSSNGATSWLPEDVAKQYPTLSKFKDVAGLAKSYAEMDRFLSSSARVPPQDAPPEQWEQFYNRIGRPETPDKYELATPDGTQIDDNVLSVFRAAAHKAGLTQAQWAEMSKAYLDQAAGLGETTAAQMKADIERWDSELKQEWGWATDRNKAIAGNALASLLHDQSGAPYPGLDEVVELLDSTGLGNHPVLLKAFHWIGQRNGEDQFVEQTGPSETDLQGAKEELARLTPPPGKLSREQLADYSRPEIQNRRKELYEIIDQYEQFQRR